MLTPGEIAAMRGVAEQALPGTAVISGGTFASDGGGGGSVAYLPSGTVSARLAPLGGGETGTPGDRIADESTHIITLPATTSITEASRVTFDGKSYEVTLVRERGTWELTRRIEVKESP